MKAKGRSIFFNGENLKAGSLEAGANGLGIHRYERVSDVEDAHPETLQAIAGKEDASGLQDTPHLAK